MAVGYAACITSGAYLLFLVQPLLAKYILPWFGGGPGVWTAALMFFQILLVLGYAYAHVIATRLTFRAQVATHLVLLAVALAQLPVIPSEALAPSPTDNPTWGVVVLLARTVGLPYLALAATTPLMQSWMSRATERPPYWLFAVSNAGALAALAIYPLWFEPTFSRPSQAWIWSAGFGLFVALTVACAWLRWKRPTVSGEPESGDAAPSSWSVQLLWLALPATASALLLAVTNQMTRDLVVNPLFWVAPLAIYLVTFILAFSGRHGYPRWLLLPALPIALVAAARLLREGQHAGVGAQIATLSAVLFVTCLVCHGELGRLRPGRSHLTRYYLFLATGGALGGLFVSAAAPVLFSGYRELPIALVLTAGLAVAALYSDPTSWIHGRRAWPAAWALKVVLIAGASLVIVNVWREPPHIVEQSRSFFGVLRVVRHDPGQPDETLDLLHGRILHAGQYADPQRRQQSPVGYYARHSGAGVLFAEFRPNQPRHVGVVGLGSGVMAGLAHTTDRLRFYEVDPDVQRLADKHFTFLRDTPGAVSVVLGDARLSMQREVPQLFDVLFIDAFSGDAIPTHLVTKEAVALYLRHVKPDGILAFHITTYHLDFAPILLRLAEHYGLYAIRIVTPPEPRQRFAADWLLLSRDPVSLDLRFPREHVQVSPPLSVDVPLWTDDHSSVFPLLFGFD